MSSEKLSATHPTINKTSSYHTARKPAQPVKRSLYHSVTAHLMQFPRISRTAKMDDGAQLSIGDLHGNALTLLFILIKHSVFTNLTEQDYLQFFALYAKDAALLTAADLKQFQAILDKAQVNPEGMLRLLGDDLADRGSNDYFTLKIFEKLANNDAGFEVVFSNHCQEFIESFERGMDCETPMLGSRQAASLANLKILIDKGLVDKKEIQSIVARHYLPRLKALSYSVDEKNNKIAIYTHAPVGLETIEALAQQLGVAYQEDSIQALAKTIDAINEKFQEYAKNKNISTLLTGRNGKQPLLNMIWNRDYATVRRPRSQHGYFLKWVHGHDSAEKNQPGYIYNLDNQFGKANFMGGSYNVHYTHEKQYCAPVQTAVQDSERNKPALNTPANQYQPKQGVLSRMLSISVYPLLSALLIKLTAMGICYAAGLAVPTMLTVSAIAAVTAFTLLTVRNYIFAKQDKNLSKKTEVTADQAHFDAQTLEALKAYRQGNVAGLDNLAYAKSFFSIGAWKHYRSFGAGMYNALHQEDAQVVTQQASTQKVKP